MTCCPLVIENIRFERGVAPLGVSEKNADIAAGDCDSCASFNRLAASQGARGIASIEMGRTVFRH